jgi:hypothetical protein
MTSRQNLISPDYLVLQRELHGRPEGYGGKGKRWVDTVEWLANHFAATSVLDYGCGQGTLGKALRARGIDCRDYDPAIHGKNDLPAQADLVVCTDVIEHIEPVLLPNVLTHMHALARKALFVVVSLRESNKTMSDGRNAHLIVRSSAWWAEQTSECWNVVDMPDLPLPRKISRDKNWIAVVRA